MKKLFLLLAFIASSPLCIAQQSDSAFKKISIAYDSTAYLQSQQNISIGNIKYLQFQCSEERPTLQINVEPAAGTGKVRLLSNEGYTVTDSLKPGKQGIYTGHIRLADIIDNNKPVLQLQYSRNNITETAALRLLAIAKPTIDASIELSKTLDIFQEEEKRIEVPVSNAFNLKIDKNVIQQKDYDYRLSLILNTLAIYIKPHTSGSKTVSIPLQSITGFTDDKNVLDNYLPPLELNINVKPFKLTYINFDKNTVYLGTDYKSSEQILADYNPFFELNKTYRIEDQQGSGGLLVAELYVEAQLDNSHKMLCRIRPFAIHKIKEGYLYIKDAEKNRFLCNLNISEKPRISKIALRREGGDWEESQSVHPGENVEIKIEGRGLQSNKIQFDGLPGQLADTSRSSDEAIFFKLKIPVNISSKHLSIFFDRKETAYQLNVKDYQKPAPLDFISINYGQSDISLGNTKLNKPLFYDNVIKDVNIVCNPDKIDINNKLYGKQYLNIEVKLLNKDNDLIEVEKIDDVVICPGETSPRKGHYDVSDCSSNTFSLNDYLDHKTYHLPAFTQIVINISHKDSKYSDDDKGFSKKTRIILVRKYNVDLQLSFPTGLLVKKVNEAGIGSLSGISAAVLLNVSPYDSKQFGSVKPYSLGVGFLALNALNLTNNTSSDVGIVTVATVQPIRKSAKFSVPIYAGGGYLVKEGHWFFIFGPGLQFNF